MLIVDVHTHVYQKIAGVSGGEPFTSMNYGKVSVGNGVIKELLPSFVDSNSPVEMLLAHMDAYGVQKAILNVNPLYGYHNDYVSQSVKKYSGRLRGIALVNILKGEKAAQELADIYDEGTLFGMKIETASTFQHVPNTRLCDAVIAPVFECMNDYNETLFIHPFRDCDIQDLKLLVKKYSKIKFVICHMGADACFGKNIAETNYSELLQMAKNNKNIYFDTSSVPATFLDEEYPFPTSCSIITQAYKTLGPERIMWASDYPTMLTLATFQQLINIIMTGCKEITPSHKELIMGKNADELFFKK